MRSQLFFVVVVLVGAAYAQSDPPDTVGELDVNLYLGRWFQVIELHVRYEYEKQKDAKCFHAYQGKMN